MSFFDKKITYDDWKKSAEKELNGKDDLRSLTWQTHEGIEIKSLYTKEDLDGLAHLESFPGFPPYTRGPKATMYYGRPWTIRQYAGFSSAEESNRFYRKALKSGQKGLSIAFDLASA